MNIKAIWIQLIIMSLVIFVMGLLTSIVLHYAGFTHLSISSWRYWVGFSSLAVPPMTVSILLGHFNISHTSILGRMMFFYSTCITAFCVTTFLLEHSIDLWSALIYITIFSIIYPCILFFFEHPWMQRKIDMMKNTFTRKK